MSFSFNNTNSSSSYTNKSSLPTLTVDKTKEYLDLLATETIPMSMADEYEEPADPDHEWSTWSILLTTISMSLLILEIIFGNLLVITAILTQRQLRTPSNMIILSMAVADLAVGVFILPFNIADMLEGWRFGEILCRIWLTSDVALCATSILHISAIAVDRFRSINEGVSYAQSKTIRVSLFACAVIWLISLWIASSPVLGWNDWQEVDPSKPTMECAHTTELGFVIHAVSGAILIPAAIIVGLYIRIFLLIRSKLRAKLKLARGSRKSRHLQPQKIEPIEEVSSGVAEEPSTEATKESITGPAAKLEKSNDSTSFTVGPSKENNKIQKKASQQIEKILKDKVKFSLMKERKAAKTLGIIIGAFIFCWSPFTIVYLTSGFLTKYSESNVPFWLFQFATWLGYVNSGLNPIIYTIYNNDFRRAFKIILCQCSFKFKWKY